MAQEIERKFLVVGEFKSLAFKKVRIKQAYLSTIAERTIRIRRADNKAFITIKGISTKNGVSRYEWEKEILIAEAEDLFKICENGVIDKTRYFVKITKHIYEIDEFHGENKGLFIAEIELSTENEAFDKPNWLAQEVTGNLKYYNSNLMKQPYLNW